MRRTNLLWGLVALALAGVVMAGALGVLPPNIFDLITRAWPALLVLAGVSILLKGRAPFSDLIALFVSLALVAGVGAYAFTSRASQEREDNNVPLAFPVRANLPLLRVRVNTLTTDVELLRAVVGGQAQGAFVGSIESVIDAQYVEADDGLSATLTITEIRPSSVPRLEAVGRGRLLLELPPDVPLDVEFTGTNGDVTVNMSDTRLERLNVNLAEGDALVTLPVYDPQYSQDEDNLGTLAAQRGNMTVFIPPEVAARLDLERGPQEPDYDPSVYNLLFDRVLEARNIDDAAITMQYTIVAPAGRIRLQVPAAPAPSATATADAG